MAKQLDNSWGVDSKRDSFEFLVKNPAFHEMPASINEFLGPGYLDVDPVANPSLGKDVGIRESVRTSLIKVFGEEISTEEISVARRAMFTGGIGIGKTTLAAIVIAYMVHWVLCLKNPQQYFGLLKSSRIAFMLMSTKDTQAKEVLFGDIKGLIAESEWFKQQHKNAPWGVKHNTAYDPMMKNQLRFPKNIWVLPGNSAETTFEGYNILGGILDEGDSHRVTDDKDYAESGYNTIHSRIGSRFTNPSTNDHRGLLVVVGQMKKQDGFMAKKKKELLADSRAVVIDMTIWESRGWEYYRNSKTGKIDCFYYDINRRKIVPPGPALEVKSKSIMKIPMAYFKDFDTDPVKALRDHAGIPPAVDDPFIPATDRIDLAQDKWEDRYRDIYKPLYVVSNNPSRPEFHPSFACNDPFKRTVHIDIGYAGGGDAMGMAMGHVPELIEIDDELKPIIVIDFLLRIKPPRGKELMLEDFRKIIYMLRDEYKFNINAVTYDGFQSVDSIQLLHKKRFNAYELSIDRKKGPYEDLREAIYERRIEFPRYMTYLQKGENDKINIIKKELSELTDMGGKIDHPPKNGSKDVADALAGVTHVLMVNNSMRRGAKRPDASKGSQYTQEDIERMRKSDEDALSFGLGGEVDDRGAREVDVISVGPGARASRPAVPPIDHDPFGQLKSILRRRV